jgi:hypothetical protein
MERRSAVAAIVKALVLSLLAAGCGGSPTAPTPTPPAPAPIPSDSISLTNMVPASGTTLLQGQTVTFTGTVAYSLASADSGAVVLVIQDQANHLLQPLTAPQPSASISKGTGQVTLSQSIALPGTGITRVHVFFPLVPSGVTGTDVVVSVSYPVQ